VRHYRELQAVQVMPGGPVLRALQQFGADAAAGRAAQG